MTNDTLNDTLSNDILTEATSFVSINALRDINSIIPQGLDLT